MLVCTKKKVYKKLKKNKVERLYLENGYKDEEIDSLIAEINKDEEQLEVLYVSRDELDELVDDEKHEGIVAELPDSNLIIFLFLIISSLLLFFIVVGISFSLFDTTLKGTDVTKNIIVNYSDVNGQGNGINITNASSISDSVGKNLTGTGNYFDFTVSGETNNSPVNYYVVLEKESNSTLNDNNVKVFLTKLESINETFVINPIKYSLLEDKNIENVNYKLLYTKEIGTNVSKFSDSYRFRIWVSDDAIDYYDKTFSVKVNVFAEGVGE